MKPPIISPFIALTNLLAASPSFEAGTDLAWGGNSGWISFRHDRPSSPAGAVLSENGLHGHAWSANLGWIFLGDGSPDNGFSYSNTASDHGVNHDGQGNLSGYAWSANSGWIHFGWAMPSDPNRPRVNLVTGEFLGYALSANTGWIHLGSGALIAESMARPDTDADGIADAWEMKHFNNLTIAGVGTDADKDGSSDLDESLADTDPDDSSSNLRIVQQNYLESGTSVMLEFTSSPSRLYRIEQSPSLGIGSPWMVTPDESFPPSAASTTTKEVEFPAGDTRFFRVRAVVPLQP